MKTTVIKNVLLLLMVVSTIAYLGCASTAKFNYGDADNGFMLSYRGEKGDKMNYQATNKMYIVQDMMGQEMEVVSTSTIDYELKVKEIKDNADLFFGITFNKFESTAETPQGTFTGDTDELIGKSAGILVSAHGKVLDKIDFDKLPEITVANQPVNLADQMREVLVSLPSQAVRPGDTWEETRIDTIFQGGIDVIIDSKTNYTLKEVTKKDDIDCLRIEGKTTFTMEGEGSQMGADLLMEGDGEGESEIFFSFTTGTLLSQSSKVLLEGTVIVSGPTQMTIPLSQEITASLELLK